MNIINGDFRHNGSGAYVEAEGGVHWPLDGHAASDGQRMVYGVRPEHLSLAGADAPVQAEVIVVEPTSAETELLVRAGSGQIIVVIHGRTTAQPGDSLGLAVDVGEVHLFDQENRRAS
ncbi:MAG: TOBE domain-containing protein [Burkholderiales bacterium]|nr:TOBE domain-containing protein [Burkholderiales bacterium]